MKPYFQDALATIYCGDMRDVIPLWSPLDPFDAVVTDPPYEETSLSWDRWPDGWPLLLAGVTNQLWCFGSMRMFIEEAADFAAWKFAQDIVWEKHNGSGFAADRFKRVHEAAAHFYRGEWSALHRSPPTTEHNGPSKTIRKRGETPHTDALEKLENALCDDAAAEMVERGDV